jgi:succinoglycan biosynthesis protein ExoO
MWLCDAQGRQALFIDEALDGSVERLAPSAYVRRNRMFSRRGGDGTLKPLFAAPLLKQHGLRYDPQTRIGEDFLLVAEAMISGASYGRVRSAGYVYATGGASISRRLSPSDAEAMIAADERLILRHANRLTRAERAAWCAHLSSLQDAACFVAMVESIKRGDVATVVRQAARRPFAIRHFAMPIRARLARRPALHEATA